MDYDLNRLYYTWMVNMTTFLKLHCYNADSIVTWSLLGSQIFYPTQLFYQHTPIDTPNYKYVVCYNYKTEYAD